MRDDASHVRDGEFAVATAEGSKLFFRRQSADGYTKVPIGRDMPESRKHPATRGVIHARGTAMFRRVFAEDDNFCKT
jgi:hypothetical protein